MTKKSILSMFLATFMLTPGALPLPAQDETPDQGDDQQENESSARERGRELFRQQSGSQGRQFLRNNDAMLEVFADVVADASESTVKLMSGRRQICLGTVISEDGYVLSKASELRSGLQARTPDGTSYDIEVVGIERNEDLALLKLDAENLIPVTWEEESSPIVGSWLVTAGQAPVPLAIGVVSVASREIPPPRGILGVYLSDGQPGAKIDDVVDDSPAQRAGLQVNDIVLQANGEDVADRPGLQGIVGGMRPGQIVTLQVKRGEEELEISVELGDVRVFEPGNQRSLQQNQLGSRLSDVRDGFSSAIQQDAAINNNECGGPVVGLNGKAIGINIARAGRVSTYVLPFEVIRPLVEKLMTGEFSPAVVFADKIDKLDDEISELENSINNEFNQKLEELDARLAELEERQAEVDQRAADAQQAADDAKQTAETAQVEADELRDQTEELKKSIRATKAKISRAERKVNQLKSQKDALLTSGVNR